MYEGRGARFTVVAMLSDSSKNITSFATSKRSRTGMTVRRESLSARVYSDNLH